VTAGTKITAGEKYENLRAIGDQVQVADARALAAGPTPASRFLPR